MSKVQKRSVVEESKRNSTQNEGSVVQLRFLSEFSTFYDSNSVATSAPPTTVSAF